MNDPNGNVVWGMQTAAARVAAAPLLISMNEGGVALNRPVDGEWEEEGVGKATYANFRAAYETKRFATAITFCYGVLDCTYGMRVGLVAYFSHDNALISDIVLLCLKLLCACIRCLSFGEGRLE